MPPKILFVGKAGDSYCGQSAILAKSLFPGSVLVVSGKRGDAMPIDFETWEGDYIISYLSPWIIPASLLDRAKIAAINFHPGPPEYPGIGCTNFAIYDGAKEFGITCHHMLPKVDTGKIIAVRRFMIYDNETVWTLTQACYDHIFGLFGRIIIAIYRYENLPSSPESWTRKPYKREELNALCRLSLDMSAEEIQRRVRALTFPGAPGAYFEIAGIKWVPES